jgi:hypothetical protein
VQDDVEEAPVAEYFLGVDLAASYSAALKLGPGDWVADEFDSKMYEDDDSFAWRIVHSVTQNSPFAVLHIEDIPPIGRFDINAKNVCILRRHRVGASDDVATQLRMGEQGEERINSSVRQEDVRRVQLHTARAVARQQAAARLSGRLSHCAAGAN